MFKFLPLLFLLVACDSGTCPAGDTCIANTETQASNNATRQARSASRDYGLYGPITYTYPDSGTMKKIGFIGKCDIYTVHVDYEHIITICPNKKTNNLENKQFRLMMR
jgi:hypothetical protein